MLTSRAALVFYCGPNCEKSDGLSVRGDFIADPNFEKWDRNTEKHLVFCVLSNILAIFEPVVGDFYEHFSN